MALSKEEGGEHRDSIYELHETQAGADGRAVSSLLERSANLLALQTRGTRDPYDEVLEYWWDNAAHLVERTNSPEGQALTQEVLAYEKLFVDLGSSTAFFTET